MPATPIAPQTPHTARNPFDRLPDQTPLAMMYNSVLDHVQGLCFLVDAADGVSPHFALLENIVVPRIATAIRLNLGRSIFSAGRPDELHKVSHIERYMMLIQNYTTTAHFLGALEGLASSAASVTAIRGGQEISSLNRQWQLPVYFQLRWKDIVARLEKALEQPFTQSEWSLCQSSAIWQAVETCWSPNVYLAEIGDRFWKLHLQVSNQRGHDLTEQILSRYRNALQQALQSLVTSGDVVNDDTVLRFAAKVVMDIERMRERLLSISQLNQVDDTSEWYVEISSDKSWRPAPCRYIYGESSGDSGSPMR